MAPSDLLYLVYIAISWIMLFYGANVYYLLYRSVKNGNPPKKVPLDKFPFVTIQLPIYNEQYVVNRLIQAVCRLNYPKDRMEVQVLDDSTDSTREITKSVAEQFIKQGFAIRVLTRENRIAYKAGALQYGLNDARGDFIAIFDADFIPHQNFLLDILPYFSSKSIGMVQVKWGHLNESYSTLTKAQSINLDTHFLVEQKGKSNSALFMNFNGTAGMWRKECIVDSGGWRDSLAEDLDLSFRAQLRGWKLVFLHNVSCPAELPVQINASKRQQFRWAKGSIQCARRLLKQILTARVPYITKVQAFVQLTRHIVHPLVIAHLLILPALMLGRYEIAAQTGLVATLVISPPIFTYSLWKIYGNKWPLKLSNYFYLLLFGAGISVNNSRAVVEGLIKKPSEFLRTPKFGIVKNTDTWKDKKYVLPFTKTTLAEIALALYGVYAFMVAIITGNFFVIPYIVLLTLGFTYVAVLTIAHSTKTGIAYKA
ncbi:MAG: glycosyltransferase [Thaumarchaeota archaeon]|nr:glycosyltransferase [Nitrososphaerota archaeon]